MEKDFEGDEKIDVALVKEALEKNATYAEAAKWLTSHLVTKYGPEFGGTISVEYDLVESKFTLKCGEEIRVFEEDQLGELPSQIRFLRKMRSK